MKTSSTISVSTLLVLSLIILGTANIINAQRIVQVPQGVGTLDATVRGDTLPNGQRVNINTIYELQKGGYYITLSSIENINYPLHIRAAAGGGKKPIIRPGVSGGGVSNRPFQARNNLTLEGVYVTNLDEQNALLQNIIRLSADNVKLTVIDSHLDRDLQAAVRCDAKNQKVIIKNSIISNIGTMQSPDNGRGVDDRGNDIDTLIYENNTWYNLTSRILRDGGGIIKYAWINHNTVINVAQWGCSIGAAIEAHFRNNLFINTGFLGASTANVWFMFETAALPQSWIDQGFTQKLRIHNNNFYVNPQITAALPSGRTPTPVFNAHAQAAIDAGGWGSTIKNEAVAFTASPGVPLKVMQDYFNTAVTTKTDMDKGGGSPDYGKTQMPFILTYPTSSPLYTAGTANQPLGDLNYFGIPVGVTNDQIIANDFQLFANYPNPFNPSTNIKYALPVASNVKVEIFNMLGQLVNTLVNQHQQAGTYNTVWNGNDLNGNQVSTGVYVYKLTTDNFVSAKKMILVK
jgi:hypothetical protein